MKTLLLCSAAGLVLVFTVAACATSRGGYSSAPYTVSRQADKIEIRDYPALTLASTSGEPGKKEDDGSFMRLFGYISGGNEKKEKIAMTTPVFMDTEGGAQKMSFVLPEGVTAATAPAPAAGTVKIQVQPARRCAVLRYSGLADPEADRKALEKLQAWLAAEKLTPTGPATYARFDPPWTPGPLRRNEVMLPLPAK